MSKVAPLNFGSDTLPGLLKAGEEGCELGQVVFKMAARPDEITFKDGDELFEKLVEEAGDLAAALSWSIAHMPAHAQRRIHDRAAMKYERFDRWHAEQATPEGRAKKAYK